MYICNYMNVYVQCTIHKNIHCFGINYLLNFLQGDF